MRTVIPKPLLLWVGLWTLTCFSVAGFATTNTPAEDGGPKDAYASANPPRILVLGDSLSAAYNIPREAGWVNLLREQLQQVIAAATVVNESISGATTAAGLQVFARHLQEYRPNVVILQLGANDGLQGKPILHITGNLRQLIELAQAENARVVLVGVRLPPNYGVGYTRPFFNQYAQLSEAYELAYVPFILEGVAGDDQLMQEDGLHPVAEAQPRILANVWPAVAEVLGLQAAGQRSAAKRSTPATAR